MHLFQLCLSLSSSCLLTLWPESLLMVVGKHSAVSLHICFTRLNPAAVQARLFACSSSLCLPHLVFCCPAFSHRESSPSARRPTAVCPTLSRCAPLMAHKHISASVCSWTYKRSHEIVSVQTDSWQPFRRILACIPYSPVSLNLTGAQQDPVPQASIVSF